MVPIMGHIQGLIRNLSSRKVEVSKSCFLVLRQLANNKQCADSLIAYPDTLSHMIAALKLDSTITSVACETLDKMFKVENEELVLQAIKSELVQHLLKMLDAGQSTHNSSTKALVVQVLKAMQESQTYGEQVAAILDKSHVWAEFKDQKHDLFISNTPTAGYLTGNLALPHYRDSALLTLFSCSLFSLSCSRR